MSRSCYGVLGAITVKDCCELSAPYFVSPCPEACTEECVAIMVLTGDRRRLFRLFLAKRKKSLTEKKLSLTKKKLFDKKKFKRIKNKKKIKNSRHFYNFDL